MFWGLFLVVVGCNSAPVLLGTFDEENIQKSYFFGQIFWNSKMATDNCGARNADMYSDDEGGAWSTVTKTKRQRNSTGGTFSTTISHEKTYKVTKEQFKALSTDEKLVSLYDMMLSFGSLNTRVNNLECSVQSLIDNNVVSDNRIKLLEYKSIDMEARNRRNNLIFRGHPELVNDDDCEAIIKNFLSNQLQLDSDSIYIQRAHRLGNIKPQNRRWAQRKDPRPIIVCFRHYKNVETIMSNAFKLRGTKYGINRDYPNEIVSARSRLWADYKSAKSRFPEDRVFIGFPAKLIVKGRVVRDEFPDWKTVLKGNRVKTPTYNLKEQRSTDLKQVFPTLSTSASASAPAPAAGYNPLQQPTSSALHDIQPTNETTDDVFASQASQSLLHGTRPDDVDNETIEITMESEKSDSETETETETDTNVSGQDVSSGQDQSSTSSTDVTDQYSQAMAHLQAISERGSGNLSSDPQKGKDLVNQTNPPPK